MTKLTRKQWAAVELLAAHMTSKEIARELGISPSTVDQRLTGAMRKLGAVNRRELARLALALCLGLSLPFKALPGGAAAAAAPGGRERLALEPEEEAYESVERGAEPAWKRS